MHLRTSILFFFASLAIALAQPQTFIVELNTAPPALDQFRGGAHRRQPREFVAAQTRVRESQTLSMRAIRNAGGVVLHQLDTIANALIVEVPDAKTASRLYSLTGVKRVEPVVEGKKTMDRVIDIHKIRDVWNALPNGPDSAGEGIKVAIVDTGVDITHPGLSDDSLPTPGGGYPKFNTINEETDRALLDSKSNKKVIVMRSYENLVDRNVTKSSARDLEGHGTGTSFAAVGRKIATPMGSISGVAPRAHLGVYRITAGAGGSSNTASTFAALDDAVKDGMDVINLSFGFQPVSAVFNEATVQRIYDAGVIFVASAGNEGPGLQSMAWPGSSPWVIGVGASGNDRSIRQSVVSLSTGVRIVAANLSSGYFVPSLTGTPLKDASTIENNTWGCRPFPADSLRGAIALIQRGNGPGLTACTFEMKLNNAANAGAVGVIVMQSVEGAGFNGVAGTAKLPGVMVSIADGTAIRNALRGDPDVTLSINFTPTISSDYLDSFSSRGPSTGILGIKPDVLAVGDNFVTALPTDADPDINEIFGPSLTVTQGTSLSSPVLAGAAALLKQARPGLRFEEYRSLLVNTATPLRHVPEANRLTIPQEAGAGRFDLSRARVATVTANPLSISFGGGTKTPPSAKKTLKLTNIGDDADTFAISVEPMGDSQSAAVSTGSLDLNAKSSGEVEVTLAGSDLREGAHHGMLIVKGSKSDVEIRVPYWYGVGSTEPGSIAIVVDPPSDFPGGSRTSLTFRVTDAAGLALDDAKPEIEPVTTGGVVDSVDPSASGNGLFIGRIRPGRTVGLGYQFRIKAGNATRTFTVFAQ